MYQCCHFSFTETEDKDLIISLPDHYSEKKRYPVLYIMDGQNAFFDEEAYSGVSWGFKETCDDLGLEVIMVAIPCVMNDEGRMGEYGPWKISEELSYYHTGIEGKIIGGQGEAFIRGIVTELKPYIDRTYSTDIHDTAIIGSSMGAVISAYACLQYPDVFPKAACLSTAFWFYPGRFEDMVKQVDKHNIKRFYLDVGEYEGCGNTLTDQYYLESNHSVYVSLMKKRIPVYYQYIKGATHNERAWRTRLPKVLTYLYQESTDQ